jgi:hypothetical protein
VKATITLDEAEITNLIRQHLLKVQGINKIAGMKFNVEVDRADDRPFFTDVTVSVELKELSEKI